MSTLITQNRSNLRTFFGFIWAIVFGAITIVSIVRMWPPELSLPWFLMYILAIGTIVVGSICAYWLLNPRDVSIEISKDLIRITDQPILRWKERFFDPREVEMIHHNPNHGTALIDKNGKHHIVSDILMMKKIEIFKAMREIHPHIKIKSDEIPNKSLESDA